MVQWELQSKHPATSFGKIVERHVGTADAKNMDSMISAYEALYKGKFNSAEDIRRSFTKNGQPLFTPQQAASVFRKIQPMSTQKGGAPVDSILNDSIRKAIDSAAGITPPSPPNPAIQGGIKSAQMVVRMIIPFIFILDTLENTPLFGDLIGAALDVTAAVLPVMASTIQTMTPSIVGLIPIPLAGTVGILLGWLFSLFFLWLAMVIGISRKEFAAALEATAGMVPVIGPALSRGVKAVETVGTKFYNRADKISASISKAFGSLQGAIAKVKSTASSLPSLDKFAGPNPPALPSLAQIQSKAAAALPPLPAPIPAAGEDPTPPSPPTASSTPPTASSLADKPEPKKAFPPVKARKGKKGGRGRFTRRKRSINRKTWPRTTRRR
jgi:hypothetical protein